MDANPSRFILPIFCAAAFSFSSAHAKLAAWFPLDDFSSTEDTTLDNVSDIEALLINFDADFPEESFINRVVPSARGNLGGAYSLDTTGGLDLSNNPAVQPTDKFTMSFWFQPRTLGAFDRLFESLNGNTNMQSGIRIDLNSSGSTVRVLALDGSGSRQSTVHPTALKNDGTWYFFALRYDSAAADTPLRITLIEASDSLLDETAMADGTAGPADIATGAISAPHGAVSFVGVANGMAPAGTGLDASIDEIAFFDNSDDAGVLTDAQLADVYNFGPSGVELISTFESDVASIPTGGSATLSWTVNEPFDSLVITDSAGTVTDVAATTTAGSGSTTISPTNPTTYFLKATRGDSENVSAVSVLAASPPLITNFDTSAKVSLAGDPVTLNWAVVGATSLSIDPGATDITGEISTIVNPSTTTTYTLTATNGNGSITSEQTIVIIAAPLPANRYVASIDGNTNGTWQDQIGINPWNLGGTTLNNPALANSVSTNITAAYSTNGGVSGGNTGSFRYTEFSAEIWLTLDQLTSEYDIILESGGGIAGISCIVNQNELRFLGSSNNVRNLDVTIPISGFVLSDFVQVVFSYSSENDTFTASIRDTSGQVGTVSATDTIIFIGGNSAGLFAYRGGDNNIPSSLGGHTEGVEALIPGLVGLRSEIAIVNIYDRVLTEADIVAAFDRVSTGVVDPPADNSFSITSVTREAVDGTLTLTWSSTSGNTYDAQFLDASNDWINLDETIVAEGPTTTKAFFFPPTADRFFLRIIDLGVIVP